MKKTSIIVLTLIVVLAAVPVAAQTVSFDSYRAGFQKFADGVATSLPLNAAIGLNWSDAYIGNFPHLGVGATVGAATMPYDAFKDVGDMLGINIADEYPSIKTYGAPIPAVAVEGRLGGFILPFDVGVKVGFLPESSKALLPDGITADYVMFGGDVRLALLKGGVLPKLSVGVGYTYLKGEVNMSGMIGSQTITGAAPGLDIQVSDPNVTFNWEASVIDLKAELSKSLAIITPYIGVGASLAVTSAGGGLDAKVTHVGGAPLTPTEVAAIAAATGESFDPNQGFFVTSDSNGWGFRAFGGLSFNLLILKLDLTGLYNFTGGTYGASLSGRVQL